MNDERRTITGFAKPHWNHRGVAKIICTECQKDKVHHKYDWFRGKYEEVQVISPSRVELMPVKISVDLIGFRVEQTIHRGMCGECGTLFVFAWPVITENVEDHVLRERDLSGQTERVIKQIEKDFGR